MNNQERKAARARPGTRSGDEKSSTDFDRIFTMRWDGEQSLAPNRLLAARLISHPSVYPMFEGDDRFFARKPERRYRVRKIPENAVIGEATHYAVKVVEGVGTLIAFGSTGAKLRSNESFAKDCYEAWVNKDEEAEDIAVWRVVAADHMPGGRYAN